MSATAINLVNTYYQKMQDYLSLLNEWKFKSTTSNLDVKELERQKAYHNSNGDTVNELIVDSRLNKARSIKLDADINVSKYQKLYDDAEKLYLDKKDTLLSENEVKQLSEKQNAENALLNTKVFAQKNTQYLIIAGFVIAVIVIGFFIFKKLKSI